MQVNIDDLYIGPLRMRGFARLEGWKVAWFIEDRDSITAPGRNSAH